MIVKQQAAVQGIYSLSIRRNAGKPNEFLEELAPFKNLILDGFFSRWATGVYAIGGWRFFVGTDATPPVAANSALGNLLGAASNGGSGTEIPTVQEGSDYIGAIVMAADWPVGAIVGNISEIGVKFRNQPTNTELDSRALIKDPEGAPTTITLTVDDQLVVNYTLRFRIPIAQQVSTKTFDGVSTTCTLETLNVLNDFGLSWGVATFLNIAPFSTTSPKASSTRNLYNDVTANNTGDTQYIVTISYSVIGSTRRVTLSASPSQFNVPGGIKYITLRAAANSARQGILFNPPIDKTIAKTLVLHFDYSLARA